MEARAELEAVLQQAPRHAGLGRSQWWLAGLQAVIPWLKTCSLATVSKTLKHFRLRYKRGRESLHSPDPDYALKRAYVKAATAQAHADPVGCVLLYQDELTYYRRPRS